MMRTYSKLLTIFFIFTFMFSFSSLAFADGMIEDTTPEQRDDEDPNVGNMDVKDPGSPTKSPQPQPPQETSDGVKKETTTDQQPPQVIKDPA